MRADPVLRGALHEQVTYKTGRSGISGVRKRVVNGKRTDLCDLLMRKFRSELKPKAVEAPALFQGHTRFATSSIANFDGCHPHQWLPPQSMTFWRRDESGAYVPARTNLETFITHNGDLDFFEWHSTVYPLDDVFKLLESFLGTRRPASVDSAGVAGLLDLLRCKGLWLSSVRYGYVFGGLENAGNLVPQLPNLWKPKQLQEVAQVFVRATSHCFRPALHIRPALLAKLSTRLGVAPGSGFTPRPFPRRRQPGRIY